MPKKPLSLLCLALAGVLVTAEIDAQSEPASGTSHQILNPDAAAAAVRRATGGKVLNVEATGADYQVKVLMSDGRVRTLRVDGRTGRLRD
jgi:uncharacterized membrane protein YkoI